MTKRYIFDVDGTLTAVNQRIDDNFSKYFLDFCKKNYVYLVSGGEYDKVKKQLGEDILKAVSYVYTCSGNEVWKNDKHIFSNNFLIDPAAKAWLKRQADLSDFLPKTGSHFKDRNGSLNFSVVGHISTGPNKISYTKYDNIFKERETIIKAFNDRFPSLLACKGGSISIDITGRGLDKSQILKYFSKEKDSINFFGDSVTSFGNDFHLYMATRQFNKISEAHAVKCWEHTYGIIQAFSV